MVAAATDHGNEVLAHLGAITGLPMAANCVSAARGAGECRLVRQRWAGSLLEDAVSTAPLALLTVAADAVPADAALAAGAAAADRCGRVELPGRAGRRRPDRAGRRVSGPGAGVSLASARVVVGGGRGVGGPDGFAVWRSWPGCSAGWWASPGW